MMYSNQRYLGPSDEETTLRPTTPMSHAASDSSRTQLIETAFRPVSPRSDFQPSHSPRSAPKCESRSVGRVQKDPEQLKFWKPYTIRPPFLILLMILALLFIAATEILYHYSEKEGGFWFIHDENQQSLGQYFVVQYLPTILAVLYGILWSLVDLDVKRLEPFYELGRGGGAEALFLEYQYQFPLAVPFRAGWKKHWAVFLSSSTYLLCTLAAAPLLSGLVTDKQQIVNKVIMFNTTSRFVNSEDKIAPLSPEFMFAAATAIKHNSSFPPFTTADYSIIPFDGNLTPDQQTGEETWKAQSTAYRLAVDCVSPTPKRGKLADFGIVEAGNYHFTLAGTECKLRYPQDLSNEARKNPGKNITWWDRPDPWCGPSNMTTFATFAPLPSDADGVDLVGFWCTPTGVESATVEVEIEAATGRVNRVLSKPDFRMDREVGAAVLSAFDKTIFDTPSIEQLGSDWAVFSKLPLAPAEFLTVNGVDIFADPEIFRQEMIKIYRLWFSMAVATTDSFLVDTTANPIPGIQSRSGMVVIIDRTFAILVDVCFGLIFLNCFILFLYVYQRRSSLLRDPDSISGILALVAQSELLQAMDGLDRASSKQLKEALQTSKYGLGMWSDPYLGPLYKLDWTQRVTPRSMDRIEEEKTPRTLRLKQGILFLTLIIALTTFISILYYFSLQPSSLPAITENSFLFGLIWSAVPTLIATLMEPMWGSLNRDVSVIQPFYNLIKRNMPASRTISQKYAVVPFILTFRAFKSRDILLGTVSGMTVLTSLLAVTLPGIFDNTIKPIEIPISLFRPYIPQLDGNSTWFQYGNLTFATALEERQKGFSAAFLTARANISEGVSLPPWTNQNYSFVPVFTTENSSDTYDEISIETTGLAARLDCREIINGTTGSIYQNKNETTTIYYLVSTEQGTGDTVCQAEFGWAVPSEAIDGATAPQIQFGRFPRQEIGSRAELYRKIETESENPIYLLGAENIRPHLSTGVCANSIVAAWSSRYLTSSRSLSNGTVWQQTKAPEHTIIVCYPQLVSQNFRVTVDKAGAVLQPEPISDPNVHEGASNLIRGATGSVFIRQINGIFYPISGDSQDWPGLIMTKIAKLNSKDYLQFENLFEITQATYSLAFDIFLALHRDELLTQSNREPFEHVAKRYITRVEMSAPLTILSLVILFCFLTTLVVIYTYRRKRCLPRHPTTLAATIAYFWDSHLLDDIKATYWMSTQERELHLSQNGDSYGFGWYQGKSGKKSLGVDREPLLGDYKG